MKMVMCLECGNFVKAHDDEDGAEPIQQQCPRCGAGEFKDTETGDVTSTKTD